MKLGTVNDKFAYTLLICASLVSNIKIYNRHSCMSLENNNFIFRSKYFQEIFLLFPVGNIYP
jgi:hypothetical protein